MGTILKIGAGTLESRLNLGGKKYVLLEEFFFENYKINVQKTKNFPVNDNTFRNHWKFSYFDKKNILKVYITGEPQTGKKFHLHKIQNCNLKEMSNLVRLFHFGYNSLKEKLKKNYENPYKKVQMEKGLLIIWKFFTQYLEKENFKKIITKSDHRFYDALDISFKVGWRDKDRERKLEQFSKNILERNNHLKTSEKISGLVELEYLL